MEYFLLPDDLVPRKLDLVLVGLVAKLSTHSNSKVKETIDQSNPKCPMEKVGECFGTQSNVVA